MLAQLPWRPNYVHLFQWRQQQLLSMAADPKLVIGALEYYRTRPIEFINHWCDTYDPRNAQMGGMVRMPFVLFKRQEELVTFLQTCLESEASGLIEKSRDMGATWLCCAFSVWLWLFMPGCSIGWGSRKADLVDKLGLLDSIFEKIRMLIRGLPPFFLPAGYSEDCMTHMRVLNPENGSSISGESGDDIGRGGRKTIYFKDESAHYERPELIEAALSENTRVQVDMSSVQGLGTVFHRKREAGVDWYPGQPVVKGRTNVFVMDWRDHPLKTQEWYETARSQKEQEGLLHVFAQEVDRNYAASVENVIIPDLWVKSAIDAHLKLGFDDSGAWCAALDVADGGMDLNALAKRKGVVLRYAEAWGERDTGLTTRRALDACRQLGKISLQYDCVGVGAGVKAEANRLRDEKLVPLDLKLVPWNAGSAVLDPEKRVVNGDRNSPLNKDFYGNLKAQGWWNLRLRFERTHRMVTEGIKFPVEDLISLDSKLPKLRQVEKELCQPTTKMSGAMKLLVDKAPEGSRSPNLADAIMMCYFPVKTSYDVSLSWVA